MVYSGPRRKTNRPRRRERLRVLVVLVVLVVVLVVVVVGTQMQAAVLKGVAGDWWGEF